MAQVEAQRGKGRAGIIGQVIDPAAAVAEEGRTIADRAIVGQPRAARVAHIDQCRIAAAAHFEQMRGPQPAGVDLLPRLVKARGEIERAAADVERAVQAEIIGDIVEAVEPGVEQHHLRNQRSGRHNLARIGTVGEHRRRARSADAGGDIGDGIDRAGEGRDEAARDVGEAETVGYLPAVEHIEARLETEGFDQRVHTVADIEPRPVILSVERGRAEEIARMQAVLVDVETGDIGIIGIGVAAGHPHRVGQIADRLIIEIFAVEADIATFEFAGDVQLDLATGEAVVADVARPLTLTIEAADMHQQIVRQARAIVEIDAIFVIIEPGRNLDRPALGRAGLGNEVDYAARRVGGKGRCRTAAHRLHPRDIEVGAQENIGIAKGDVAEFEDRQAVFLQLQEFRAARCNGKPAHGNIGIALTARRFGTNARQRAQDFSGGARCGFGDLVARQRADRYRAVEPVAPARHGGHDDVGIILCGNRFVGRCGILCERGCRSEQRDGQNCGGHAGTAGVESHRISPLNQSLAERLKPSCILCLSVYAIDCKNYLCLNAID